MICHATIFCRMTPMRNTSLYMYIFYHGACFYYRLNMSVYPRSVFGCTQCQYITLLKISLGKIWKHDVLRLLFIYCMHFTQQCLYTHFLLSHVTYFVNRISFINSYTIHNSKIIIFHLQVCIQERQWTDVTSKAKQGKQPQYEGKHILDIIKS